MDYLALSTTQIWTLVWTGWIALFVILEGIALYLAKKIKDENPNDGGTLSEFVWRLLRSSGIVFIIFTIFWSWLTLHFLTGKV